MSLHFLFAWYDAWVGFFWASAKRRLYIFPVPCIGCYLQFPKDDGAWLAWKLRWGLWQRIRDLDGKLKLTRIKLTPKLGRFGQLYLHKFHASEYGMPFHDHAYNYWTIPLGTTYLELVRKPNGDHHYEIVHAWKVAHRAATHAHLVDGPALTFPFYTLFWQGPQIRKWGFWVRRNEVDEWIYWKDYYSKGNDDANTD